MVIRYEFKIILLITLSHFVVEAARPWRYDLPQERKSYDSQWVYRPYQERIDKYYQNPNVSPVGLQENVCVLFVSTYKTLYERLNGRDNINLSVFENFPELFCCCRCGLFKLVWALTTSYYALRLKLYHSISGCENYTAISFRLRVSPGT